jgi:uncharacterized protein (TIRG00374 family)
MPMRSLKFILAAFILLLTLFGSWQLFAMFSQAGWREVLALLATISPACALLLALLTLVFYLLDWVRFRSVLAVLGYRLRWPQGLQLTCVSYFVTSLTPMAELHTPAMVLMLTRYRVGAPQALAATLTKSIYMTLWICLVSYLCLMLDDSIHLPPLLHTALPFLSLPLLGIAVPLGLIAFFPQAVVARTQAWHGRLQGGVHGHGRLAALLQKLLLGIGHSAESIAQIGQSGQLQHAVCHLASITFLLVYVAIGLVLARFFGLPLGWWHAVTVFSTSLMIAYLAPVPGAIGVTELATAYMLDPALGAAALAVGLCLRILCWYLVALPGGLVLLRVLRTDKWPVLFRQE